MRHITIVLFSSLMLLFVHIEMYGMGISPTYRHSDNLKQSLLSNKEELDSSGSTSIEKPVMVEGFFDHVTDSKELHAGDTLIFVTLSSAMRKSNGIVLCDSVNGQFYSNPDIASVILEGSPHHWYFRLQDGTYLCWKDSKKKLSTTKSNSTDYCEAEI